MVHNVLFDPPLPQGQRINVGDDMVINDISSIYNLSIFKNLFRVYFTFLLVQYILIYACVPLEEIENRPAMCIISNIYILIMFTINASILPLCSSTIPTLVSLRCLFCSFVLELGGTVLNMIAVVHSVKAGKMYQVEKERGKVMPTKTSVEVYINVFIILAMVFSILATSAVFTLVVICERALEYITSKVDRRHLKAQKLKIGVISTDSIEKFNQQQENYF